MWIQILNKNLVGLKKNYKLAAH